MSFVAGKSMHFTQAQPAINATAHHYYSAPPSASYIAGSTLPVAGGELNVPISYVTSSQAQADYSPFIPTASMVGPGYTTTVAAPAAPVMSTPRVVTAGGIAGMAAAPMTYTAPTVVESAPVETVTAPAVVEAAPVTYSAPAPVTYAAPTMSYVAPAPTTYSAPVEYAAPAPTMSYVASAPALPPAPAQYAPQYAPAAPTLATTTSMVALPSYAPPVATPTTTTTTTTVTPATPAATKTAAKKTAKSAAKKKKTGCCH